MSLILKALNKAQRKYADNTKPVFKKAEPQIIDQGALTAAVEPMAAAQPMSGEMPSAPGKGERRKSHAKLQIINAVLSIILAVIISSIVMFLNDHITTKINATDGKIENVLSYLKKQDRKISDLDKIPAVMSTSLDQMNRSIVSKIDALNAEVNYQKEQLQLSREEFGKNVVQLQETRQMLETYKSENANLKSEVESLKQKVDAVGPSTIETFQ